MLTAIQALKSLGVKVKNKHLTLASEKANRTKPSLVARFASSAADVKKVQKLRAKLFAEEYGVKFNGLDADSYDPFCLHIMVFDQTRDRLVATTRLLTQEQARLAGGFYSAHEFDVSSLQQLPGRILEIGRTCVHPDYRSGGAITVLWSFLADYFMRENFNYLIGCASISLADGGMTLAQVMPVLREKHFVAPALRTQPTREIRLTMATSERAPLPPLLKAYLRMGCQIGGEACWDPEFNCADVFIFLDVQSLSGRYAQKFLKTA